MRLILWAAAAAAGTALALTAGQEPARADDKPPAGTISSLLDTATGGTSEDRPTPVRDTVKTVTGAVDKTVTSTTDTTKKVTDTVDKATEPLPVTGKVVDKVTDLTDTTIDTITARPTPARIPSSGRDGSQPEPDRQATDRHTTPPPTTKPGGPTTVPELAKRPPRASSSGTPPTTVRQKQPTHDTRQTHTHQGRSTTANQPAPPDGTDLGDLDRAPATTSPIPVDADTETSHTLNPSRQRPPDQQPRHIHGRPQQPAPPSG